MSSQQDVLIPFINSLIVLNEHGERIIAKYYDGKLKTEQSNFETAVFTKSKATVAPSTNGVVFFVTTNDDCNKSKEEMVMFRKLSSDCFVFIVGSTEESALILAEVLEVFTTTLTYVLKGEMTEDKMSNNLHYMLLIFDELLDDGNVLDLDAEEITQRVLMKKGDAAPTAPGSREDLASQAVNFFRNITSTAAK